LSHARPPSGPPPTIADLRWEGLRALLVRCLGPDCYRPLARIEFDTLGLPEVTPFPQIKSMRRFRCQACGSTSVDISPDWTEHNASWRRLLEVRGRKV
jgi:hypothetical protein